jgi:hypothetical protein
MAHHGPYAAIWEYHPQLVYAAPQALRFTSPGYRGAVSHSGSQVFACVCRKNLASRLFLGTGGRGCASILAGGTLLFFGLRKVGFKRQGRGELSSCADAIAALREHDA